MADYALSDDAALDLQAIYRSGLDHFGEAQADLYLDELYHLFELFADNPQMGVDFEISGRKLQRYPHKSHVIIFEPVGDDVTIRRVFHGGSDYLNSL